MVFTKERNKASVRTYIFYRRMIHYLECCIVSFHPVKNFTFIFLTIVLVVAHVPEFLQLQDHKS